MPRERQTGPATIGPPAVPTPKRGAAPAPVQTPETPIPRGRATDPPGRPDPLVVNMPEAKVDTTTGPAPHPPDLRLPHERDQSAVDTAPGAPDPVIVQAAKDLADGQVDTDLRNPGGLDAERRRRLLKGQR